MRRPPRIAVYGEFGTGNIGNDASLMVAVSELRSRWPGVKILCLCNAPDLVARRDGMYAMAIKPNTARWQRRSSGRLRTVGRRVVAMFQLCVTDSVRMYRIMRDIDVLMVPGTGIMESGTLRPVSFAAPLFMTVAAARIAGARVALVSIGADITSRRMTRALSRWTLRLANYRSFRDTHSKTCAQAFGARCAADDIYPDLVFGLGPQPEAKATSSHRSVGVGVINYRGAFTADDPAVRDATHAAYMDLISSFVTWLVRNDLTVKLLPGDRKDEDTAAEIRDSIQDPRLAGFVEVACPDSFSALLQHMQQVDWLVVTRYHNIVGAALVAKPVISLNHRQKNVELMTGLCLKQFQLPLRLADDASICEQFTELRRMTDNVSRQLEASSREYHRRTQEQWIVLERILLGSG
jgi:polysaccharide pyruvyl transferase WcaK-like protein